MKLVVFGPFKRLGALMKDGEVVDLNLAYAEYLKDSDQFRAEAKANFELPANLQEFIEQGSSAIEVANTALKYAQDKKDRLFVNPIGVKIWAPLPGMHTRLISVGSNYARHMAGITAAAKGKHLTQEDIDQFMKEFNEGKHPLRGFWKLPQCVVGPDEPIIYPSRTKHLDCEVEFTAVIGKMGKNIPENESVMDYIFGYTGHVDWSIRDYDHSEGPAPWRFSKNFDTSASLGPCIVTKDEIPDPYNVRLQLWINGEIRQDASTNLMMYKFPIMISHVSRSFTIYPGDMLPTGSPAGTGMDRTLVPKEGPVPTDYFVKVGDTVEFKVEYIGSMKHMVIKEK